MYPSRIPRSLVAVGAGLVGLVAISQIILRLRSKLHPRPIPLRLAGVLRSSTRRRLFGSPEEIVERAGVAPGMHVLEIGPGTGYFTPALARCVAGQGKQGRVTCVEIQPEMIDMLRQHLNEEGIEHVEIVQGDAQKLSFSDESFDLIFLATVVGEVPDTQACFTTCARLLKPGGTLAVTEYVIDNDFLLPGAITRFAVKAGFQDAAYSGVPWWTYTARYRKPNAVPNIACVSSSRLYP